MGKLIEYVRETKTVTATVDKENGILEKKKVSTPVGVLVAVKDGESIRVGWSRLNRKLETIPTRPSERYPDGKRPKPFVKKAAVKVAMDKVRSKKDWDINDVPKSMREQFHEFLNRATTYFRVEDFDNFNVAAPEEVTVAAIVEDAIGAETAPQDTGC